MIRIGVLASGSGSNLQAILDACAAGKIDGKVAVVVCNVPGARAVARAEAAGVEAVVLPSKGVTDRPAYDRGVTEALRSRSVDLVCLAGFMRILSAEFIAEWGFTPATRGLPRLMKAPEDKAIAYTVVVVVAAVVIYFIVGTIAGRLVGFGGWGVRPSFMPS